MQQLKPIILSHVYANYLGTKRLKPKTIKVYDQMFSAYLRDWQSLPMTAISQEMILSRHKALPHYSGNLAMRLLRALFKFQGMIPPTDALTRHSVWNKEHRRKTILTFGENGSLRTWFKGATALEDETIRHLLLFLLFTGLRKGEALDLRWEDVDLGASVMTIRNTKNGETVTLPLNTKAIEILQAQGRNRVNLIGRVFATSAGTRQLNRVGVKFCLHDLRRTFMTAGDEIDLNPNLIKQLVNHKFDDVTEGYICRSNNKLGKASQLISDYIINQIS